MLSPSLLLIPSLALALATCASFEEDTESPDLEMIRSAVSAEPVVTYLGKTSNITDLSNLGTLGYYFPQYGQSSCKDERPTRDNAHRSLPSWQGWEWNVLKNHRTFSPDSGVFDASKGGEGIGVESSGGCGFDWIKSPSGWVGQSGTVIDRHAKNNVNNTVNEIQMKDGVPGSFCMSILTDNTNARHNPVGGLTVRLGKQSSGSYDSRADVPDAQRSFDNRPDVHTFKFENMSTDAFIKIRLYGGGTSNPGFGGLMFDRCPASPLENQGYGFCVDGSQTYPNMWFCTGATSQNWTLRPDKSLFNPATGKCLDGNVNGLGYHPYLWDCDASNPWRRWTTYGDPSLGVYRNEGNGLCLDAYVSLGNLPYMFTCSAANPFQRFQE